jgi:hypothetical protein
LLGRDVDVVTEGGLREPVRTDALREAIHVWRAPGSNLSSASYG